MKYFINGVEFSSEQLDIYFDSNGYGRFHSMLQSGETFDLGNGYRLTAV